MSTQVSCATVNLYCYLAGNSTYKDGRCLTEITLDYEDDDIGYFANIEKGFNEERLTQLPIYRLVNMTTERLPEALSLEIEKVKKLALTFGWINKTTPRAVEGNEYLSKYRRIDLIVPDELKAGSTYRIQLIIGNKFEVTASFIEEEREVADA